jgi:hypothetical protein
MMDYERIGGLRFATHRWITSAVGTLIHPTLMQLKQKTLQRQ